jgi:ABC transporter with metal-binding/Fe-S-binding domain ATP-binding protein
MYVAALISGGKDSTLAFRRALKKNYKVRYLVTMIPRRENSWMFHFQNIHLTELFAEAVGIKLVTAKTTGIKEKELADLKRILSTLEIDGVVHGAISSLYQKARIDRICHELNLRSISPLWLNDPVKLLKEMISLNFEIIIVGVSAYGFDPSWLGRKITQTTIHDLIELNKKYQISPVGEGGEYETLVVYAPFFKGKIRLLKTEKIWENHSGYLLIQKAELLNDDFKNSSN